jgi:hypothetical protein
MAMVTQTEPGDPLPDPAALGVGRAGDFISGPGSDPGGISALVSEVRQLAADAKTLAEAELAYQSSRARLAGSAAKGVALHGLVAFVLAVFALVALVVGLLLALTPLVTAWGATAIVAGGLGLLALLSALRAKRRWARAQAVIAGETDSAAATGPMP